MAAIGLAVVVLIGGAATVALRAPNGLPARDYVRVSASVPDSGNLRRHNEVRIAGVRVGQVLNKRVQDGQALLELQLDPSVGELPADTAVFIRGRGLLGQRYLELRPGDSDRSLPAGAVIRGAQAALTFGVSETLDTLDARTRGALADVVGEMGRGLLSRGRGINAALQVGPRTESDFQKTMDAILARPGALQRLVPSLDRAAAATQPAAADIAGTIEPARRALGPFVDRAPRVRQILDVAPSTLDAARPALVEGRRLLASVRAVARAASSTLPESTAGLRATTALLRESPRPLRRTAELLREAGSAVPAVLRITRSASPVLEPLRRAFATLRDPAVKLGEHGCDLDNFVENWRDFLSYGVAGGGPFGPLISIRIEAIAGPGNIAGGGDLTRAPDALVDRDPYPRACRYSPGPQYPLTTLGGSR